jgi:hypothetical protein
VDKAALVDRDLEFGGSVVAALSRAQIPVTLVDWDWVPQLQEWQLIVVTSLHDTNGPREAYARIIAALKEAGDYETAPMRRLFVKSPEDPIAKKMIQELKIVGEGSIHILKHVNPDGNHQYSVVFAPYSGTGGPIPSVSLPDNHKLRQFLGRRLGITSYLIDDALTQLSTKGSASIFNVRLSLRRAKTLGLVA